MEAAMKVSTSVWVAALTSWAFAGVAHAQEGAGIVEAPAVAVPVAAVAGAGGRPDPGSPGRDRSRRGGGRAGRYRTGGGPGLSRARWSPPARPQSRPVSASAVAPPADRGARRAPAPAPAPDPWPPRRRARRCGPPSGTQPAAAATAPPPAVESSGRPCRSRRRAPTRVRPSSPAPSRGLPPRCRHDVWRRHHRLRLTDGPGHDRHRRRVGRAADSASARCSPSRPPTSGSAHYISALGLDNDAMLVSNGAEGTLRLNIPVIDYGSIIEPFGFVGLGWSRYELTQTTYNRSNITTAENVMEVPYGAGPDHGLGRLPGRHPVHLSRDVLRSAHARAHVVGRDWRRQPPEQRSLGAHIGFEF